MSMEGAMREAMTSAAATPAAEGVPAGVDGVVKGKAAEAPARGGVCGWGEGNNLRWAGRGVGEGARERAACRKDRGMREGVE